MESPEDLRRFESKPICNGCAALKVERGFELPLCAPCRRRLARRPFPDWIKVSCIVLMGIAVFACVRSVSAFRAAVALRRGEDAERQGHFALAAECYEQAAARFPDFTPTLARVAIMRIQARQMPEAQAALRQLSGRKMSPKLAAELNRAVEKIGDPRGLGINE